MKRVRNTLGPLIAYHGCDRSIAEAVLAGKTDLKSSHNEYDWLGPGIYFWVDSPERGLIWSQELSKRKRSQIKNPYVLGALVHPGLCLNLTDYGVMVDLLAAHAFLGKLLSATGTPLPENTLKKDGIVLRRTLDCAVIKAAHQLREEAGEPPYDTVYGVFEEGLPLYPGAGFKARTHVQIAVRHPEAIVGYFRVKGI